MELSRKVEKKELQKFWKCRKSGERFVYFIFDGLTLYILFLQFIPDTFYTFQSCVSIGMRDYPNEFIGWHEKSRNHVIHCTFDCTTPTRIDRSPCLTLSLATLLTYMGLYTFASCLKMKNLLGKNSNICQTLYAFQKFILFFRVLKFIYWFINVISCFH